MSYQINERAWVDDWEEQGVYKASNDSEKPTSYVVDMFPYPSGSSMHVGHPRGYVATDVYSRMKRMQGYNVLHPMGWDAFGLPAEQTAIQNNEYPAQTVATNVVRFKNQLLALGLGYDWDREINTTDPEYYKQTQTLFLEFFRRGLAYNDMFEVNWCEGLGTVLANEDIIDGKSERGDHPVELRPMRQWMLKITEYADRLYSDLDKLDLWPDKVKNAQRNWIKDEHGELKMRDWVFSRQRFWGEPFPIVWVEGDDVYQDISNSPVNEWLPEQPISYTDNGKTFYAVPVIPEYLDSMRLPQVESYEPTGEMEGPLAGIDSWVNAFMNTSTGEISNTPQNDINWVPVRRETNTMPQWAGSSWYWLRYMDPNNVHTPFSVESSEYWGPVNIYAGADHAVAHLIYARFWHKVLFDAGMLNFDEPFERLEFLGYILASDGTKISKRKGNSRSPEEVIDDVGADAFRLYEMVIGPFEKAVPWQEGGLKGARRFLEKFWDWSRSNIDLEAEESDPMLVSDLQKLIQDTTDNIENFKFNIAGSDFMTFLKKHQDSKCSLNDMGTLLKLLAPFCPFITEEVWTQFMSETTIHLESWPQADESKIIVDTTFVLPVQVNGKMRGKFMANESQSEEDLKEIAINEPSVMPHLEGKVIKKIIYIKKKIINIVAS